MRNILGTVKQRPLLMGIVNVTPDSFSDGGLFVNADAAVDRSLKLEKDGADIIDIGGESTRPGAESVSVDEEISRVLPVIEGIRRRSKIPISIDTTKSQVAKAALDAGACMVNDISAGRFDPGMFAVVAGYNVPICLMHMQGNPKTMQVAPHYEDLFGEIHDFLAARIETAVKNGIPQSNIVIDPGIGFGKSAEENLELVRNLRFLNDLGCPVLIGTSKKSFIGKLLELQVNQRLEATLATLALAFDGGASIFRVHDIAPAKRFLDMYSLLRKK